MNVHLENIKKLLQDTNFPEAEKLLLLKQLSDADKQWAITDFKLDRTEKVKRTTAILLEETIEELEQKRRAVEAQNRELEIETALERVRTVAMAMRKPADLLDICKIVYTELQSLGFVELRNAMINIHNDDKSSLLNYDYADKSGKTITDIPYNFHPLVQKQVMVTKNAQDAFFEFSFTGEELKQFRELRKKNGEQDDPKLEITDALHYYFFSIGTGSIGISSYSAIPAEKLELLKRFRNVFNLSYQRYTDIALAETQARDAQIELALERVRARTMAMQKSEELAETAYVLLQQFNELGETPDQITIGIVNEKESVIEFWITLEGKQMDLMVKAGIDEPTVMHKIYKAWKQQKKSLVIDLTGQELTDYINYRNALSGVATSNNNKDDRRVINTAFFSKGLITFSATEPQPVESIFLLERFAAVFDGTYTRFLDLQKAEASAREAQIELGLERVRARAMAMQHSDELAELVDTVFKELTKLDFALSWCMINIIDEPSMSNLVWGANPEIGRAPESYHMLFEDYRFHHEMFKGWKEKQAKWVFVLKETEKEIYDDYLFTQTEFRRVPEEIQKVMRATKQYVASFTFSNFGGLQTVGEEPLSEASMDILARFGKVFDLTYTRFNDLQKAEAQAKEARIETALERVRAAAMALKRSEDLSAVCKVIYSELIALGFTNIRNAQIAINLDLHQSYLIFEYSDFGMINMKKVEVADGNVSPLLQEIALEMAGSKNAFFQKQLRGKEFEQWRKWRVDTDGLNDPRVTIAHSVWFYLLGVESGLLGISTFDEISEEQVQILTRFKNVFELSYRRYADVAQAEAQAREAKIETALERVRSRSLAMHNTSELQEVIHTVHKEFLHLNIAINGGSFIAINDDIKTTLRCWGSGGTADTTEEVKLPLYEKPFCTNLIHRIKKGPGFFTEEYTQDEKKEFFTFLFNHEPWSKLDADHKKDTLSSPGGYTRSCCVSPHTSIFIINHFGEKFSSADNDILKRFGKVFEQTYTRFLDLQKAEAQAREAEIELALERVRARTMAMQHSDELAAASFLLDTQVRSLGIKTRGCAFNIYGENDSTEWFSSETGTMPTYKTPRENVFLRYYEGGKKGEVMLIEDFAGKACEDHYNYLSTLPVMGDALKEMIRLGGSFPARQIDHVIYFKYGYLLFITLEPIPEAHDIFKRFAKVFEQTYTRFLDLQKAEAQARESQIQLALERVRARTMAMQHSDELQDAALVLVNQVKALSVPVFGCGFNIWDNDRKAATAWMAGEDRIQPPFKTSSSEDVFVHIHEAAQKSEALFVREQRGEELETHYRYMTSIPTFKAVVEKMAGAGISVPTFQIIHCAFFAQGYLMFITYEAVPEAHHIFKRFASVFEQTYTRFLDLQKAEAQAREAQIELALERVRARTMAMQHSEELKDAASLLFQQVSVLGVHSWTSGFQLWDKDQKAVTVWTCTEGVMVPPFNMPATEETAMIHILEAAKSGELLYVEEMDGEALENHYKYMVSLPSTKAAFESIAAEGIELPAFQIFHAAYFSYGFLLFITRKPCPEAYDIFKRFAKVFDQTYTRFLDLQKAEAQTKEAEIQLALERVRARTMAMQQSGELNEVSTILFNQLRSLGGSLWTTAIVLCNENSNEDEFRTAFAGGLQPSVFVPNNQDAVHIKMYEGWKNGSELLSISKEGNELKAHYDYMMTVPSIKDNFEKMLASGITFPAWQKWHAAYFTFGYLMIITTEPYHDEQIFGRFAKVFDQSYTRFLDLQKAEAQAREARIQLAMERVRARTMAMQRSDELADAASLLFKLISDFDIKIWSSAFQIWNADDISSTAWASAPDGSIQAPFRLPYDEDIYFKKIYEARQRGDDFFVMESSGKELEETYHYMFNLPGVKEYFDDAQELGFPIPTYQITHCVFFPNGYLMFITYVPCPEMWDVFKRFAKVFEQTYTRFLDLQKAEAQAREAEIELSLERVRSKAMAMHSSADILSTTATAFEELKKLGIHSLRCGIGLLSKNSMEAQVYASTTDSNGFFQTLVGTRDMNEHASLYRQYQSWLKQENLVEVMSDEELKSYYNKLFFKSSGVSAIPQIFDNKQYGYYFSFADGLFYSWSDREYTENEINILTRFKTIVALTFRRFLDLEKAEAQAKEGQIQLALERVRARTMAMQKSEELAEVATLLFKQVNELNIKTWTTGFNIWSDNDNAYEDWITNAQGGFVEPYTVDATSFSVFKEVSDAKKNGKEFLLQHLEGDLLKQTYEELSKFGDKKQFEKMLEAGGQFPLQQFDHFVFGSKVSLMFITYEPVPEAHDIFKRFGKVFEQTYTRFLDLQKAEAQAKESQIEAALEKVRSRTLAMQKSDELAETAAVLFQQLIALGIEPNRLYIAIVKDEKGASEFWITDEDGTKISTAFSADMNANVSFAKMFEGWKQQRKSLVIDMQGDELQHYFQHLTSLGVPFKNGLTNKRRVQDIAYFSKGFIGIASPDEQPPETLQLLERFAAVFNLTFTRFNDLKIAEAHAIQAEQDLIAIKEAKQKAEAAFTELQATQKQLIQSEKMASL
ncbi:MAG: hypothetical protein ABIU77_28060, partial [Ferruginibacter sp.]